MSNIETIDYADFEQHIIAIEFLFDSISCDRFSHLSRVLEDNIEYPGMAQGRWTFDDAIHPKSMMVKHLPIACNVAEMGPMLKAIKRDVKRTIAAYNKLCRTDFEYDSFKIHFWDRPLLSDCD